MYTDMTGIIRNNIRAADRVFEVVTELSAGPGLRCRHRGRAEASAGSGGSGIWGAIATPHQGLPDTDVKPIAQWLAEGAKR